MKVLRHTSGFFPILIVLVLLFQLAMPFAVFAQDLTTPTDPATTPTLVSETPAPTEGVPEIAPTDTPTEIAPVVESTPTAEILTEAPAGTDVVVLDSGGDTVPLDVQDAAKIMIKVDPMWCPAGAQPNDLGCTNNMTIDELLADMRANPNKYAADGVIFFDNSAPITSSFVLDNSAGSLDSAYSTLNTFNLSLFGGWNGGSSNTFDGQTLFDGANAFVRIGTYGNPWMGSLSLNNLAVQNVDSPTNPSLEVNSAGSVTMNNISVNGSGEGQNGIQVNASNVQLTNVSAANSGANGIAITASDPGNVTLNNVTAQSNGTVSGSTPVGSGVLINGNNTNVTVNAGSFTNNALYGINALNSISTTIPVGNVWTDASDYAPGSVVTVSGGDNSLNGEQLGFTAGETVHIDVSGPNGYAAACEVTANTFGKWSCPVVLWSGLQAEGNYFYTAKGITSAITVSGTFTDARAINWVQLNGATSAITVLPGATITASVNVTTTGSGANHNWESTSWRISTGSGGYTCVNTPNHTSLGTYTESFSITAPATEGTFNAYFRAYSDDGTSCSTGVSNTFTMTNIVITVKASTTTTITNATALATDTTTGQSYPVTFTVASTGGTPAGNVNVSDGSATCTGTVAAGTCNLTSTTPGTKTITATYAGNSTFSGSVSVGVPHNVYCSGSHTLTDACGAPSNLSAIGVSQTQINLTWNDNSTDEWSFTVERSNNGTSGFAVIHWALWEPNLTSFSDASLSCEQTRYYRVRATSWFINYSAYSNVASATTLPCVTTPTITWGNPADITYGTALDGTQLNATASVAGSFLYTPAAGTILNAGLSQTLHVDFTPADPVHYTNASKDVTINVLKATATCLVSGYSNYFDGAEHGATGTCTGVGDVDLSSSLDLGLTFSHYPGGTAHWTFTGGTNYFDQSGDVSITIAKATPLITWSNPADIVYGTALDGTQLNASADVAGNFVYTPSAGTILNAGPSQTLHTDFTPSNTTDYVSNSADVAINILKATPIITWSNPADITYPTPLTSIQLNASANVPGLLVYTPNAGVILNAGNGQTLHLDFTPTDTSNYNTATADVSINVLKALVVVIFEPTSDPTFSFGTFSVNAHSNNPESSLVTYSAASGPCFWVSGNEFGMSDTGFCVVRANSPETSNFLGASALQTVYINEAQGIVPVTGSNLIDLSCSRPVTLQTPDGYKAEFLSMLCGYQASLTEEQASNLPSPVESTFAAALTLNLVQVGIPVKILPTHASVRLTIPMPAGSRTSDYKLLFWDATLNNGAGSWVELPVLAGALSAQDSQRQVIASLTIVNGEAQFTVNFVGTFVIVNK
jgi:hypothetical protein